MYAREVENSDTHSQRGKENSESEGGRRARKGGRLTKRSVRFRKVSWNETRNERETRGKVFNNVRSPFSYLDTPPQALASPRDAAKCLALRDGSALVRMSAVMSSVGQ